MKNLYLIPVAIIAFIVFIGVAIGAHPFEIDNIGVRVGLSIFMFGFSCVISYFVVTSK
jgi:predicted tellurium resistance membrane protein TerC